MPTPAQMINPSAVYLRPLTTAAALEALATRPLTLLAGGTDFYAAHANRVISDSLLDISAIPELQDLRDAGDHWRIGAGVTWSQVIHTRLPAQFRGLQAAAREIGAVQVQNKGTLVGNVCNASPAADGIPALLALQAQVELSSLAGTRTLALDEFVIGARCTARRADEMVTALLVPKRERARSSFLKLGHRRYLVISIAMVAVVLDVNEAGLIEHAGIAVGSCTAVALRLRALENKLRGQAAAAGLSAQVEAADLAALTPLDDVRASAAYRRDAALTLVKRAIEEALHE